MPAVQCLLFNRSQAQIDQIEPELHSLSWRLNNVGRARFFLPYVDPKCTLDNLQYGNRILIRFDNGLPDFGGVIDQPRKRTDTYIGTMGYTAERILSWRRTQKSHIFKQTAPGTIFWRLIDAANVESDTGIVQGVLYTGGTPRSPEYHLHDLLARIQDLTRLTGMDFNISSEYADGALTFKANWYSERGIDRTADVSLVDGNNLIKAELDEQGEIANKVNTVGQGQSWGGKRYVATAIDDASVAAYGFREYAEVQSGVVESGTLDENANEILTTMKEPRKRFKLIVVDKEPGFFADYDIGDTVKLEAFFKGGSDWSYSGNVRILAREWRANNTCRLEVEDHE